MKINKCQTLKLETTDSIEKISCIKWTIYNGRKKVCANYQTDTEELNFFFVCRYRNDICSKDLDMELKTTEKEKFLSKRVYLLSYIDVFFKQCLYWMKQLFMLKQTSTGMGVLFLVGILRLCPGLKLSFAHTSTDKNQFLSACFY